MIINAADREYLLKNVPDAKKPMDDGNTKGVLDAIDIWYLDNGFEPPEYYDYNDEGRRMQRVRDRIFEQNCLE